MGKRDKEIPYKVVIQERKRVDLHGNVSKGPKKKYDRVNRYLTDSWIKEYCKNNNLKISRIKE